MSINTLRKNKKLYLLPVFYFIVETLAIKKRQYIYEKEKYF